MVGPTETEVIPSPVLVVDDEAVIIELLRETLEARGVEVLSEETGEGAIEVLRSTAVTCLLVDKNLPGIDGLEVVRQARRVRPQCACVVMTAFSSTESAVTALRLGANDYLEKPFEDLDLVTEKIDHAIRNQRARFERDQLSERVREYAAQVAQKDAEAGRHRSESELFEMVLQARIREATDDLRRKAKILRAALDETRDRTAETAEALRHDIEALDLGVDARDRLFAHLAELERTGPAVETGS